MDFKEVVKRTAKAFPEYEISRIDKVLVGSIDYEKYHGWQICIYKLEKDDKK